MSETTSTQEELLHVSKGDDRARGRSADRTCDGAGRRVSARRARRHAHGPCRSRWPHRALPRLPRRPFRVLPGPLQLLRCLSLLLRRRLLPAPARGRDAVGTARATGAGLLLLILQNPNAKSALLTPVRRQWWRAARLPPCASRAACAAARSARPTRTPTHSRCRAESAADP